jgi:hypothetical protein
MVVTTNRTAFDEFSIIRLRYPDSSFRCEVKSLRPVYIGSTCVRVRSPGCYNGRVGARDFPYRAAWDGYLSEDRPQHK